MEAFKAKPQGPKPASLNVRGGTAEAVPFPKSTQLNRQFPIAETWLLAPVAAPDFTLPDLNGKTRTLAAFRGKPVLLNFWAVESAECEEDLKLFHRCKPGRPGSSVANDERR